MGVRTVEPEDQCAQSEGGSSTHIGAIVYHNKRFKGQSLKRTNILVTPTWNLLSVKEKGKSERAGNRKGMKKVPQLKMVSQGYMQIT